MKILYISNSIIPSRTANSVHVMKICQAFSKNGHDVILLAPDKKSKVEDVKNIHDYYGVKPNFEIRKLKYYENFKGSAYIYGLKVAREVKKEKPDIVYGRFFLGIYFSAMLGTKVNLELHYPFPSTKKRFDVMFRSLIKRKSFNKLIVISEELRHYFREQYNLNTDQILTGHDGADLSKKDEPVQLKGNSTLNIGYVGQLYRGKGMEIISELAKKYPQGTFHIIGGLEEDISKWKRLTEKLSNIKYYGFVPHAETGKYIQACDVMIAPYLEVVHSYGNNNINLSKWMSPLKIFEYMSYGKAILTSDLPVLREILTDRVNAFLCTPSDINSWLNALKTLEDKHVTKTVGFNARKTFEMNYTWEIRAKKIINFIID